MNEQRKLICWSPHAKSGPSSPHANEFLVCSSSLRLFRASPQFSSQLHSGSTQSQQQHDSYFQTPQRQQSNLLAPSLLSNQLSSDKWSVAIRSHEEWEQQSLSSHRSFQLLDSISYPGQLFKCIGWSHSPTTPYMVGGGQISGKLVVMNFATPMSGSFSSHDSSANGGSSSDAMSRIVKEFHPRYARACHVVCFNPTHTSQVAVGLDRVRNGCGTLIWDVEQKGAAVPTATTPAVAAPTVNSAYVGGSNILNTNRSNAPATANAIETVTDPLGRVSNSEATLSLNWLPGDPFSLAVGTGFKWLRIYDIRGNSRPTSVVAHNKSVNGVSFDPFNPLRLCTFSEEGTIKIWDLRMITRKEIFSIHSNPTSTAGMMAAQRGPPKTLLEVEWCPTSADRLATIHRDEDCFRLWDLSGSLPSLNLPTTTGPLSAALDEANTSPPALIEESKTAQEIVATNPLDNPSESAPSRTVRIACLANPFSGAAPASTSSSTGGQSASLSSLSWHPSNKSRLLAITSHGLVEDVEVRESVPVAWGSQGVSFALNENIFIAAAKGKDKHPLTLLSASASDSTAASTVSNHSSSSDFTQILSADVSARMKVRALLGVGLDISLNKKHGSRMLDVLNDAASCAPFGSIEALLWKEALESEASIQRTWEWMMNSEKLATSAPVTASTTAMRKLKFTGALSILLPTTSYATLTANVTARNKALAPASSASPSGTVLSLLKNEEATSDSTSGSQSSSAPAATSALTLDPPSSSFVCTSDQGFLPAGFSVYLSNARSEALRRCDGWFDLLSESRGGKVGGAPGSLRNNRTNGVGALPSASPSSSTAHATYEAYLRDLETNGMYEEAARVAVFHLDLERALQSLTAGASSGRGEHTRDLGLVAMALSGYANFAAHAAAQGQQGSNSKASQLWNQTWSSALGGSNRGKSSDNGVQLSQSLQALFAFLSSFAPSHPTAASYAAVLNCLSLKDKLGFVLRYLPDDELLSYLLTLSRSLLDRGDLDALLLVGLSSFETNSSATLELIQSFVDRTADVQMAAILACFAGVSIPLIANSTSSPNETVSDPSTLLSQWISLYRTLLNQWNLWSHRAKFDVSRALLEKTWAEEEAARLAATSGAAPTRGAAPVIKRPSHHTQIKPQISVRCNFCGQSLSLEAMSGAAGGGAPSSGAPGSRSAVFRPRGRVVGAARGVPDQSAVRIRGCPHCKKSLPRCALCLVSFDVDTPQTGVPSGPVRPRRKNPLSENQEDDVGVGAGSGPLLHVEDDARFDSNSMAEFGKWFTWCQACRHGGHADHIADWFAQHEECPVTDCKCRCLSLDLHGTTNGQVVKSTNPTYKALESSARVQHQNHLASKHQHHSAPVSETQQAMLYSNQLLANQQNNFHQQQASFEQQQQFQQQQQVDAQQQQQQLLNQQALQMIQSQYPSGLGLPVDVIALAQAIQIMNLTRGNVNGANLNAPTGFASANAAGTMVPASSSLSLNALESTTPQQSPPSSSSSAQNQQANATFTAGIIHHVMSAPFLPVDAASNNSSSSNVTSPVSAQDKTPRDSAHPHGMTRAGSSAQLGAKQKGNFPLTRW